MTFGFNRPSSITLFICFSRATGDKLNVSKSISTSIGVAPKIDAVPADAKYVKSDVNTASPAPTPRIIRLSCNASVPLPQETQYLRPTYSASFSSSSATGLPNMKAEESITP